MRRRETKTEAAAGARDAGISVRLGFGAIPITTIGGFACLIVAAGLQIAGPGGWLGIGLAGIAALLLGLDPRFGALGGGLIVLLALPYGRAADGPAVGLAGLPIRPADAAVGAAVLAALARFRSFRFDDRPALLVVGALLAVGAGALVLGLVLNYEPRDIGRDLRWWILYSAAALALLSGLTRAQILASFMAGAAVFAVVVVATTALPPFAGGLKADVLRYDSGLLRLQFGNTPFVLPAIAFLTYRCLRRPQAPTLALLALLIGTVVLSLTRTSILAVLGMIGLIIVAAYVWPELRGQRPALRRIALIGLVVVTGGAAALGLDIVGTLKPAAAVTVPGAPAAPVVDPIERLLFQGENTNLPATVSATGGRFGSYRSAIALIARSPVIGHGLGSLVAVPFAYDNTRGYTIGMQPGVDDAYLTFAMKAGVIGAAIFVLLLAIAAWRVLRERGERAWLLPAWAAMFVLTVTQSFAVSNYGPFAFSLFIALSLLGYASSKGATAASQV